MYSFGHNSFWNFSFQGSAAVQSLLERPDLTLENLLDEDGLLVELKTSNPKLFNFLLDEVNFKQLIDYIICEPSAEDLKTNHKKCFKYPYVCAELLGADNQMILHKFFETSLSVKNIVGFSKKISNEELDVDQIDSQEEIDFPKSQELAVSESGSPLNKNEKFEYLDYLFRFLDNRELNFTAAGYFAKIVNNLFAKNPSVLLAYIFENRPDLLEKMVQQICSKSVSEFLAKLLAFEGSLLVKSDDETYNTLRVKTLNLLIQRLDPNNDIEVINNAAYLICETFGKYNTMHCGREVLESILDYETINYLFGILQAKNSTSSCAVALILGNIFAYYILIGTRAQAYNDYDSNDYEPQLMVELKDNLPLVAALIENIPFIVSYLAENQGSSITNQYGANVTPFGAAKLKLIELLIIALKANNRSIYATLVQNAFIETLLELFLRFEFNNMLHSQIEKVISFALDSGFESLKISLFEKAKILNFIIKASSQSEYVMSGKHSRKIRKGYMGHIVRLSNKIEESRDEYVIKMTRTTSSWREYVQGQLTDTNQVNKINLGGRDPRDPDRYSDFEDMDNDYEKNRDINDQTIGKNDDDEDDEDDDDDIEDDHEENKLNNQTIYGHSIQILNKGAIDDDEDEDFDKERDDIVSHDSTQENSSKGEEEIETVNEKDEFYSNQYWKNDKSWHTTDEILLEFGLI